MGRLSGTAISAGTALVYATRYAITLEYEAGNLKGNEDCDIARWGFFLLIAFPSAALLSTVSSVFCFRPRLS